MNSTEEGYACDRGLVVALHLVDSAPYRFINDNPGSDGGCSLRWRPRVVSAPFRFVGSVATPRVTTCKEDAGRPGEFRHHFASRRQG